jgi:hypothetical protein
MGEVISFKELQERVLAATLGDRRMYYDRQGKPITTEEWVRLFGDMDYRRVAYTELPGNRFVSTIWLGINHQFGEGRPLVFESMLMPDSDIMDRCTTEEAAVRMHERVVGWARERWGFKRIPRKHKKRLYRKFGRSTREKHQEVRSQMRRLLKERK